jgi:hypothetical protein
MGEARARWGDAANDDSFKIAGSKEPGYARPRTREDDRAQSSDTVKTMGRGAAKYTGKRGISTVAPRGRFTFNAKASVLGGSDTKRVTGKAPPAANMGTEIDRDNSGEMQYILPPIERMDRTENLHDFVAAMKQAASRAQRTNSAARSSW